MVDVAVQMPPAQVSATSMKNCWLAWVVFYQHTKASRPYGNAPGFTARQLEVRMLVIDEIRSILAGTFREQRIVLNAIRFLANDLRISLVCVGTREAKQALMTDK